MNTNIYSFPYPPQQPPAKKRKSSKIKIILIIFLLVTILIHGIIIIENMPQGAVRAVQKIYEDWGGKDEFVTLRVLSESSPRSITLLLFERSLFSDSKITIMHSFSTSGLILMAGIDIQGDTYTWRIEAAYDGQTFGSGAKKGMQELTYSGNISPATFNDNSRLRIEKQEYSDPVPQDFQELLLKYGAQMMAQALDDLNTLMLLESDYSVRDLGFIRF
jgi:hypothetical protein